LNVKDFTSPEEWGAQLRLQGNVLNTHSR